MAVAAGALAGPPDTDRWAALDPRVSLVGVPDPFPEDHYSLHEEPVELGGLHHLLRFVEGRCMCDSRGRPFAAVAAQILQRVREQAGVKQ